MQQGIVCDDPSRTYTPGTIIDGPVKVDQAKRKGCHLLPFDQEIPRLANMGFAMYHYGEGWLFKRNAGERGCPGIFNIRGDRCRFIYWAARVEALPDQPLSGQLRLVHNTTGFGRGMRQLENPKLNGLKLDERGGVVVYGKCGFDVGTDGLMFTDLYAVSPGMLVKWFAVSQHWEDSKL
jgi:hypothetical protein